jgi:hypothetical protein
LPGVFVPVVSEICDLRIVHQFPRQPDLFLGGTPCSVVGLETVILTVAHIRTRFYTFCLPAGNNIRT